MKLLVPLVIIALCVFYYLETHKQEPPPPQVAAVAPKPTPRKVYYHSPLDAPAISTTIHSGGGYTSSQQGTNWRGSHMSDGQRVHTALPDERPDPDAD